jgi:hypothetical protein
MYAKTQSPTWLGEVGVSKRPSSPEALPHGLLEVNFEGGLLQNPYYVTATSRSAGWFCTILYDTMDVEIREVMPGQVLPA